MATKKVPLTRGAELLAAIDASLVGARSPVGDALPLGDDGLLAAERAAGVALSPSMAALFQRDVGWIRRTYGWFLPDDATALLARPLSALVAAHAGEMAEGFDDVLQRFPGNALPLDAGSDSARFLYLGDPDEHGEYPVVGIDHDDLPWVGVVEPGFDVWLARELGVAVGKMKTELDAANKRLFGRKSGWSLDDPGKPTAPVAGPAPGSVAHPRPAPAKPSKARKLTDKQLDKALAERAGDGDVVRLKQLIADASERARPKAVFDAALIEAAKGGRVDALHALLAAGASPNAREYYGHALSRAIVYRAGLPTIDALLAAGARADADGVNGQTALFSAVEQGEGDVVARLIAAGADVNHAESNRMQPLHHAVTSDKGDVVGLLLAAGADPNGGDHFRPPLSLAIERGRDDAVTALIAAGADVDRRSSYLQAAPLHVAMEHGRDASAAALIRAGASREAVDERGLSGGLVYGPTGDDERELSIPRAVATGVLSWRLRIAVFQPTAFGHGPADLHAAHWAELAHGGLAGVSAQAVVRSADALPTAAGLFDVTATLDVEQLEPHFFQLLARKLLRVRGAARVVSASLSVPGVSDVSGADARAWAAEEASLPDVEVPFPVDVVAGGPPAVVLRLPSECPAPTWDDPIVAAVNRAFAVFQASVDAWGPGPSFGPMGAPAFGGKAPITELVVHLNVFDGGKVAKRLPWEPARMLPSLRAVALRLRRAVPFTAVQLRTG